MREEFKPCLLSFLCTTCQLLCDVGGSGRLFGSERWEHYQTQKWILLRQSWYFNSNSSHENTLLCLSNMNGIVKICITADTRKHMVLSFVTWTCGSVLLQFSYYFPQMFKCLKILSNTFINRRATRSLQIPGCVDSTWTCWIRTSCCSNTSEWVLSNHVNTWTRPVARHHA